MASLQTLSRVMDLHESLRQHADAIRTLGETTSPLAVRAVVDTLEDLVSKLTEFEKALDPEGWERAKVELAQLEADGTLARLDSAEGGQKTWTTKR